MVRTDGGQITYKTFFKESSFISDNATLDPDESYSVTTQKAVLRLLVDPEQERAYILDKLGRLSVYDVRDGMAPTLRENVDVISAPVVPTTMNFLTGGVSLLIGDSSGRLSQWFQVRSDGELPFRLTKIRDSKKTE